MIENMTNFRKKLEKDLNHACIWTLNLSQLFKLNPNTIGFDSIDMNNVYRLFWKGKLIKRYAVGCLLQTQDRKALSLLLLQENFHTTYWYFYDGYPLLCCHTEKG